VTAAFDQGLQAIRLPIQNGLNLAKSAMPVGEALAVVPEDEDWRSNTDGG
jgi:hypothetical protein